MVTALVATISGAVSQTSLCRVARHRRAGRPPQWLMFDSMGGGVDQGAVRVWSVSLWLWWLAEERAFEHICVVKLGLESSMALFHRFHVKLPLWHTATEPNKIALFNNKLFYCPQSFSGGGLYLNGSWLLWSAYDWLLWLCLLGYYYVCMMG